MTPLAPPVAPVLPVALAAPAPRVLPAAVATTAQRAIKVLQSSSAPAQRSLFLRPRGAA